MTIGWAFLAFGALGYGIAHFFQARAARASHIETHGSFLQRLLLNRLYWFGVAAQGVAAVAAVAARRDLPLFLVQTGLATGIGITALLGMMLLNWRLPRSELVLIGVMYAGLLLLVISARASTATPLSTMQVAILVLLPGVFGGAALAVHNYAGPSAPVLLAGIAGLAFSAAAISSRPLASANSISELLTDPLLFGLAANGIVAQLTLAHAFKAGSPTSAIASLDVCGAVPAALIGIVWLGDSVRPGFEVIAATGFALALGAVVGLARYAEPQEATVPVPVTAGTK